MRGPEGVRMVFVSCNGVSHAAGCSEVSCVPSVFCNLWQFFLLLCLYEPLKEYVSECNVQ
jgi:hypothetical protein